MKFYFILLLPLLLMKDCSKKTLNNNQAFNGTFAVEQVNDMVVKKQDISFSISPENEVLSGHSGCNQFSIKYKLDKNNVLFDNAISSKKYCPTLKIKEKTLFNCFKESTHYKFEDDLISLYDSNDKVLIKARLVEKK